MNDLVNLLREVILDQSLERIFITRGIASLLTIGAVSLPAQAVTVVIQEKCCEGTLVAKDANNKDYDGTYKFAVRDEYDSVKKQRKLTIKQTDGPVKKSNGTYATITIENVNDQPNSNDPLNFEGPATYHNPDGTLGDTGTITSGSLNNRILDFTFKTPKRDFIFTGTDLCQANLVNNVSSMSCPVNLSYFVNPGDNASFLGDYNLGVEYNWNISRQQGTIKITQLSGPPNATTNTGGWYVESPITSFYNSAPPIAFEGTNVPYYDSAGNLLGIGSFTNGSLVDRDLSFIFNNGTQDFIFTPSLTPSPEICVPEPSNILSLLAVSSIGTGLTLKRKLMISKFSERELEKVG
jgi:hypothetical protein